MKRWQVVEYHVVYGDTEEEALDAFSHREIEESDILYIEEIDEVVFA